MCSSSYPAPCGLSRLTSGSSYAEENSVRSATSSVEFLTLLPDVTPPVWATFLCEDVLVYAYVAYIGLQAAFFACLALVCMIGTTIAKPRKCMRCVMTNTARLLLRIP